MLEGFEMDMEEFIDLCILCGCDYTHNIGGIGPVKAFNLIQDHKNIEKVLEVVKESNADEKKKKKFIIPDKFLYEESRELFKNPDAINDKGELEKFLKWDKPQDEELKDFLIVKKKFQENKVESGLVRLKKTQGKANQSRLDCFFKMGATTSSSLAQSKDKKKSTASS
jgi:flap endonuclease-1